MKHFTADDRGLPPLFDIAAVWRTLAQRWLIVLGVALALLAAAVLYVVLTRPLYTAAAEILVDPRDSRATNLNNVLPDIGADSAAIASQVSVIGSADLLGKVFDAEKLQDDPEFSEPSLVARAFAIFRHGRKLPKAAAFDRFRKHLSVSREGLTYVIDVDFASYNAQKAARIANAVVAQYKKSLADEKEAANREANNLLEGKIGGLQKAVSEADRKVQEFKFQHKIFDTGAGGSLQSQIDQVSTQLVAAQDQANQAENRYEQAVAAGTTPEGLNKLSEILSSEIATKLRDEYNQRSAALANAEAAFGPRHPGIIRLKAELARVTRLMANEARRITQQLKAGRDLAEQNVEHLQAKIAGLRDEANRSQLAAVELRQLQSDADAARAVLDDFLKRSQETAQLQGLQISQVRVITPALVPVQPSWPKPALLIPVSLFLGLALGAALALLIGPAEAEGAIVPALPKPREPAPGDAVAFASDGERSLASFGSYAIPASYAMGGEGEASGVRPFRFERTAFFLSVLRLLEQIITRMGPHPKPFVLLISSIHDGVERDVAADLIGLGLKQINQKVLVVEMSGRASEAPDPDSPLFTDPVSGLDTAVVRAGASDADTPALEDVRAIIEKQYADVDFVVVNAPPFSGSRRDSVIASDADLILFALDPAEQQARTADRIAERLGDAAIDRSATITIEIGKDSLAPRTFGAAAANRRAMADAEA